MNTKKVLCATSAGCACIVFFFLGRFTGKSNQDANVATNAVVPKDESVGIEESVSMPAVETVKISDEKAVQLAKDAVCEIFSKHLEESVVVSTGRYKLVSFRIWINPHDPKPPGPDQWHSPVWIDAETGAVVPPQMPDWKPMSDSRLKTFIREWDCEMPAEQAQNWNWDIKHVSGFARIVVRDPSPPSGNIWVEDDPRFAAEYWVDETREAVICAMDI